MQIPREERSPRYYGALAKACNQRLNTCPYSRNDPRSKEFEYGFNQGVLEKEEK